MAHDEKQLWVPEQGEFLPSHHGSHTPNALLRVEDVREVDAARNSK